MIQDEIKDCLRGENLAKGDAPCYTSLCTVDILCALHAIRVCFSFHRLHDKPVLPVFHYFDFVISLASISLRFRRKRWAPKEVTPIHKAKFQRDGKLCMLATYTKRDVKPSSACLDRWTRPLSKTLFTT